MSSSMSSPISRREQSLQLRDHLVEVEDLGCEHLLAAEREQLAGQRGGALGRRADLVDVGSARRRRLRAAPSEQST